MCERLLVDGHEVAGFDNFITGSLRNVEQLRTNPGFTLFEHDVTAALPLIGRFFDVVPHLASLASPKFNYANPIATLESGCTGTRNMLDVARRFDSASL